MEPPRNLFDFTITLKSDLFFLYCSPTLPDCPGTKYLLKYVPTYLHITPICK